jgi:S1-C subfamily serine protease
MPRSYFAASYRRERGKPGRTLRRFGDQPSRVGSDFIKVVAFGSRRWQTDWEICNESSMGGPAMRDDWYLRTPKKIHGPLTDVELREAALSGLIGPETPVRNGSAGRWLVAKQIRGLSFGKGKRANVDKPDADRAKPRFVSRLAAWDAIGGISGLALLLVALFVAFELGRRHSGEKEKEQPAVAEQRLAPVPANALPMRAMRPPKRANVVAQRPARNPVVAQRPSRLPVIAIRPVARIVVWNVPNPIRPLPPVVQKIPAKDADLKALERAAGRLATAKDALALYDQFDATHKMSAGQTTDFLAARKIWQDRARQNLVRLGTKWVTVDEAAKAHETAAQLFQQAYQMFQVLNFPETRKTLEKASRADPNSIAADFTLGLLNSITPPDFRSPPTAARHFHVVLNRVPGYVPALNNLAIAEIRQKKYAEALRHLREAAEKAPTSVEVRQNLGRFVSQARLGGIHPSASLLGEATKLYAEVITAKQGTPAELKTGWLFIPLVAPRNEREALAGIQREQNAAVWDSGQGTGFVVETHYVITCRHVVDDLSLGQADRVEIIDPTDQKHEHRLAASVVAMADEYDLALLRCDQLDATPVPLASTVPPRGTEIILIGFPGGTAFGRGLKTTHGIITALPGAVPRLGGPKWEDSSRDLWHDAASSHGTSGGPVCERHGNVVAVNAHGVQPGNDPENAMYSGGPPASSATVFIRKSLAAFDPRTANGAILDWPDVDARVQASIVLIVVGHQQLRLAMGRSKGVRGRDDFYDDRFCTVCNGRGRVVCPNCGGSRTVHSTRTGSHTTIQGIGGPITFPNDVPTQERCPVCGGTGYVRCPYCSGGGFDPTLR